MDVSHLILLAFYREKPKTEFTLGFDGQPIFNNLYLPSTSTSFYDHEAFNGASNIGNEEMDNGGGESSSDENEMMRVDEALEGMGSRQNQSLGIIS